MPNESENLEYRFEGSDSSFQAAAKRVSSMLDTLSKKSAAMATRFKAIGTSGSTAAKGIDKTTRSAKKMTNQLNKTSGAARTLRNVFRTLTGLTLGKLFSDAITNSIEYVETLNLFNVALDKAATQATKFINTMTEALGLDPAQLMQSMGTFQNLAEAIGFTSDQAYLLSTNFTKLGVDLASLWNTSVEQAWSALESAMVGLSKPIRQYGIDVTQAALKQTALSLGIEDSVQSMSRASKVGLIYITVMQRATTSMGDFARTIESPANQLRILQQQFKQLSRTVGDFFLGLISGVLPYLNGIVMALTAILRTFASLMGIKVGDFASAIGGSSGSISSGLDDVADSASGAAKKMKQLIAPFDELNIISEQTADSAGGVGGFGGGGIDQSILDAMKEYDNLMDQVQMKATRIRDRLMEILGFTKHINEETGEITWTWSFTDMLIGLQSAWEDIKTWWSGLNPGGKLAAILVGGWIAGLVGKIFGGLVKGLLNPFTTVIGSIMKGFSTFTGWLSKIEWSSLFKGVGPALQGVKGAFSGMSLGSIGAIAAVIAFIALFIGALIDLWNNNEEFRKNITESWQKITKNIGDTLNGLWKNVIKPIWDLIKDLVTGIIESFKMLWDGVWPIINSLWNGFKDIVQGVVQSIMTALEGFTEFLAGIFTGDIDKALNGIRRMFLSIFNAIISIVVGAVNVIIDAINWVIGKINSISFNLPNWKALGDMAGATIGFNVPTIARVPVPNIGGYARGGFLEAGQLFEAGEKGKYEMVGDYQGKSTVMPLENTSFVSAMGDAVRKGVIDGLTNVGTDTENKIEVNVIIGGRKFDKIVYDAYTREKKSRGANILGGALYAGT